MPQWFSVTWEMWCGKNSLWTMFNRDAFERSFHFFPLRQKSQILLLRSLNSSLPAGAFSLVLPGWLRATRRGLWWDRCVRQCRSGASEAEVGLLVSDGVGQAAGLNAWRPETRGTGLTGLASCGTPQWGEKKKASSRGEITHTHTAPCPHTPSEDPADLYPYVINWIPSLQIA